MKRQCNVRDCPNEAKYQVGFTMFAPKEFVAASPVPARIGLYVCEEHWTGVSLEEVLNDEAWDKIVLSFRSRNLVVPDRRRTSLKFHPIT